MSRVAVIAAFRAAFRKQVAGRFFPAGPDAIRAPNVLAALLYRRAITDPFLAYNSVLLETPSLGHRLRELMVLCVAWRTSSSGETS